MAKKLSEARPATRGPERRPCDCCGQLASQSRTSREFSRCADCEAAGCTPMCAGGELLRGASCPLVDAGPDVAVCLQCGKPLHYSEPLTFIDNSNPGLGGCHARCVDAYHARRAAEQG